MKQKKKFTGIAKVKEQGVYKCVKYRVNYPEQLLTFLQKNYTTVCWLNVFYNRGQTYREKHSTWTNKQNWIYY